MSENEDALEARFYGEEKDQRSATQRDCDRVLYSSAFSRLGGVTQVVASDEGHPFHNRLTHSLKVAQIARRIAENLLESKNSASSEAGVDPNACEAAALAHDLGHPPFGHIGERCLDQLVRNEGPGQPQGDPDGFEGNAQTFRIVVRLAQRRDEFDGLNLTRTSLDAILKYPWLRSDRSDKTKFTKFGAYRSEEDFLNWARRLHPFGDPRRSVNADIMNWADDVAYAVHDVEDFYRAGLLPIDRLCRRADERSEFLEWLKARWARSYRLEGRAAPIPLDDWEVAERAADRIFIELPFHRLTSPYQGSRTQRKRLRRASAFLIGRFLRTVRLEKRQGEWALGFTDDRVREEVEIMKELVWYYVIERPELRTQQYGQARIVRDLFEIYRDAVVDEDYAVLPRGMRGAIDTGTPAVRAASDAVSSLTERQAVSLWRKLTGVSQDSLLDHPIS